MPTGQQEPSAAPGPDPGAMLLPELGALYRFWRDAKGDRLIPSRREFGPEALRPWLGHLSVYELLPGGDDFRIRLEGTKIVALTGEDWTGRLVSEVDARFGSDLLFCCLETCRLGLPLFDSAVMIYQKTFRFAQRLILPVAREGVAAGQVLVALMRLTEADQPGAIKNRRLILPG
jgi:hypothetical protein